MRAFVLDTALPDVALTNSAQLMSAATGIQYSEDEIYRAGERTINLAKAAKAFNMREGFTRADDTPPKRLMDEGIADGASKDERIPKDKLDDLGLSDVADKLGIL